MHPRPMVCDSSVSATMREDPFVFGAVACREDDSLCVVWTRTRGMILGLPLRYLNRPRHRGDVVLSAEELREVFGFLTRANMVVDTRERVLVDPDCSTVQGTCSPELLARIKQTEMRAKQAAAEEFRMRVGVR